MSGFPSDAAELTGQEWWAINKYGPTVDDESNDLVKWADVVPDSVPWWEGSYVATIHHWDGVDTNSGIGASVENVGTGESDE